MPTVAYIANLCPCPVEPYVVEEIHELRRRGTDVIICSARRPRAGLDSRLQRVADETLSLRPIRLRLLAEALWLCIRKSALLTDLLARVLLKGNESLDRRLRGLLHTWLGAYYALLLRGRASSTFMRTTVIFLHGLRWWQPGFATPASA